MTYYSRVKTDGEITLPAKLAQDLGLAPGERIRFEREGATVIVRTTADVVRQSQDEFRAMIKRPFTVDQFVAERRTEAAQD